ncbi:nonribosomal peptide synthetase [Penicillium expansum]|nr:nonribosomal peptide synthetase [Penicillium expansum]
MVWGTSRTDGSNDVELIEQPNYLFYLDIAAIQPHLQRNLLNPPVNIILATVIKAAWAIVIGELFTSTTNSCADINHLEVRDIVFAQFVNARGLGIMHEDRMVGSPLNFIDETKRSHS